MILFNKIKKNKIALFTSCTENYVNETIISFRSFLEHNPDTFDCFLIGNSFSDNSKQLLKENNINFINEDLSDVFKVEDGWPYPSECFWIYKGPKTLLELGYKYSLSVDSDVYCNKNLDLTWLDEINAISGAEKTPSKITIIDFLTNHSDINKINEIFNVRYSDTEKIAMGAGVLFYNNQNYTKYNFYEKFVELFKKSKNNGVARKGDDSLLALFMYLNGGEYFKLLSYKWNNYHYFKSSEDINESYILHGSKIKPWVKDVQNKLYNKWAEMENKITSFKQYNIYWYRENILNFGDEITPWLFEKIFGIKINEPCNIKETSDNVLLGVGSIMRLSSDKTEVWGSGIRNINQNDFTRAKKYHLVRGLFTRKRLLELGHDCPEAYGDPGLLLPKYYSPKIEKKYKLGVIPHIIEYDFIKDKIKSLDINVIDLRTDNIEQVVDEILKCEVTISSSLHGLITSVAYDIPTRWVKFTNKINGDGVKYYDFFSSIDNSVLSNTNINPLYCNITKYNPISLNDINDNTLLKTMEETFLYSKNDLDIEIIINSLPIKKTNLKKYLK